MHKLIKILGGILGFIVLPIFIAWVGASHVGPLFRGEFTQQTGSIEVSYISMARFMETSPVWQPRWYLGYPMSLLYTPLVPTLEYIGKLALGWSYSHGYRVLTAFAYAGSLVSVYFLGKILFRNTVSGLIAALCYGILPSVTALMFSEVAADKFLTDLIEPRRFTILVRWGEGPHIVSLLFLPLGGAMLVKFLREGSKLPFVLGTIVAALTILTNSIGAWGLAILSFCVTLGEFAESSARKSTDPKSWQTVWVRAVFFGMVSFGLCAFWFNPLFLSTFFREGSAAASYWRDQFPWGWIILILLLGVYVLISQKILYKFRGLSGIGLFFGFMFWFVYTYYASGSEKIELVPQVLRLNTEVDMAFSLLLGGIASLIAGVFERKKTLSYIISAILGVGFVLFLFPIQLNLARELPRFTRPAEEAKVDITKLPEKEVADTLTRLVEGDERVMVPGNYGFYLNYFTDIPQLRGALFQSSIHPWPDHIYYQLTNGKDGDISRAWLKAANVGWLVYSGPRELFRDYKVPSTKFTDSGLELAHEASGDLYLRVPLKSSSLVKVVSAKLKKLKTPTNAIDKEPLFAYVELLEASRVSGVVTDKKNGSYEIKADTVEDELLLVQMAHAPGWSAKDDKGRSLEVARDPLGFILISPKQAGETVVQLTYGTPWQLWFGRIVTFLTVCSILFILFRTKNPILAHTSKTPAVIEEE